MSQTESYNIDQIESLAKDYILARDILVDHPTYNRINNAVKLKELYGEVLSPEVVILICQELRELRAK